MPGCSRDRCGVLLLAAMGSVLFSGPAAAGGAGGGGAMPWEGPLDQIVNSISGPVAGGVGAIAICGFGITLMFGAGGGVMIKVMQIILGLTIAASALTWGLPMFGFGSAL